MASKRMISNSVIDTDQFQDLELSAQALYFHLNLKADDDGFVGNPKNITRSIGASKEDLQALINNNFLIYFECGAIVVRHWRIHNTLSRNRYKETSFTQEKSRLRLAPNNSYSLDEGEPIDDSGLVESGKRQTNNRRTTDARSIEEDRKEKESIEKNSIGESRGAECEKAVELYNQLAPSLIPVSKLTEKRREAINNVFDSGYTLDDLKTVFITAENSEFCTGYGGGLWKASFDWLMKPDNIIKVLEGNYDDNY